MRSSFPGLCIIIFLIYIGVMIYGDQQQNQKHQLFEITYATMPPPPVRNFTPAELAGLELQQIYVDRFAEIAVQEMSIFGIPASIILAQGLLESAAGSSALANKYHNHFGIKCSKNWKPNQCGIHPEKPDDGSFVFYATAWESYRDHSEFLMKKRYYHLLNHGANYKAWARGLKKAGYAEDPNYAPKLIRLIEDLGLYKYDNLTPEYFVEISNDI